MRNWKWFGSLILVLCILVGSASAQVGGVDDMLLTYLGTNDEMRFSMKLQFDHLMPFTGETLVNINNLLSHMSIKSSIVTGSDTETSTIRLAVDEEPIFDLTQVESESGSTLETSLLENRTLTSTQSAMDIISGSERNAEVDFDGLTAFVQVEKNYQALTDAIIPYAEEKAANYKIPNVGYSRWVRLAKLDKDACAELAPLISEVLGCGMDSAFKAELSNMTYPKGLTVALYQATEGVQDMAVYIKGTIEFADESQRTLNYLWAFTQKDGQRKDSYKFEMKKTKSPVDIRKITALYTRSADPTVLYLNGSYETTIKTPGIIDVTKVEHALEGDVTDATKTVIGTQATTFKHTQDKVTKQKVITYEPDLMLTIAEGSAVLTGTVRLKESEEKKDTLIMTVIFDEATAQDFMGEVTSGALYAVDSFEPDANAMPVSSLDQNEDIVPDDYLVGMPPIGMTSYAVPSQMVDINLDQQTPQQLTVLKAEMFQQVAGRLLLEVAKLPESDRGLLAEGLTAEDYASLLKMLGE